MLLSSSHDIQTEHSPPDSCFPKLILCPEMPAPQPPNLLQFLAPTIYSGTTNLIALGTSHVRSHAACILLLLVYLIQHNALKLTQVAVGLRIPFLSPNHLPLCGQTPFRFCIHLPADPCGSAFSLCSAARNRSLQIFPQDLALSCFWFYPEVEFL